MNTFDINDNYTLSKHIIDYLFPTIVNENTFLFVKFCFGKVIKCNHDNFWTHISNKEGIFIY